MRHVAPDERNKTISLVVPVMNEEDSIDPFLATVHAELGSAPFDLEILFIDDGSRDRTVERLAAAARRDRRVRYVKLTRNFGKEAALTAGLDHAIGHAVVPIDVDLQDPPVLIREFVRLWETEGYEMVYGVRETRHDDTRRKRTSAGMFYRIFNRLSPTPIPSNAGDFRLLDRRVVDTLKLLPERNRFMKGLFSWPGYRSIGVPYARPPRHAGVTKFGFWRLWNFALDGITSFSTLPLRVWTYLGAVVAGLSLMYMLVIITDTLLHGRDVPGYASLMSAILFLGAMQLLSIGVLGEYLGRLVLESKQRPTYVVDTISPPHGTSESNLASPYNSTSQRRAGHAG